MLVFFHEVFPSFYHEIQSNFIAVVLQFFSSGWGETVERMDKHFLAAHSPSFCSLLFLFSPSMPSSVLHFTYSTVVLLSSFITLSLISEDVLSDGLAARLWCCDVSASQTYRSDTVIICQIYLFVFISKACYQRLVTGIEIKNDHL